jgi:hypothetical protein
MQRILEKQQQYILNLLTLESLIFVKNFIRLQSMMHLIISY